METACSASDSISTEGEVSARVPPARRPLAAHLRGREVVRVPTRWGALPSL